MAVCAGALCPALVSDVRAGTASAAAAGMRADLTSASCSSDLSSSSAFLPRRFCWQVREFCTVVQLSSVE